MTFSVKIISVSLSKQYWPTLISRFLVCDNRQYNTTKAHYNEREGGYNEIPKNILEGQTKTEKPTTFGLIYDTKPAKVHLKANKRYNWCCCGQSKKQPFCDGTHMNPFRRISLRPVKFMVEEEKEYILCNCKQTAHRPFCDGTHKREEIQQHIKS
uniref:Iron-binding zinc finger CDGSH type domain-containing protein n=1 Tax=Graphocephala atropunctata TaxID=36148 RepID=A0A1B6LR38_9HEMI